MAAVTNLHNFGPKYTKEMQCFHLSCQGKLPIQSHDALLLVKSFLTNVPMVTAVEQDLSTKKRKFCGTHKKIKRAKCKLFKPNLLVWNQSK